MKIIFVSLILVLLIGCVSAQLRSTSLADLDGAIAIARTPGLENPELEACLSIVRVGIQQVPTTGGGVATVIAEKEMWDRIDATPGCIIMKARIQAFFAKFGLVIPVRP